MEGLPTTSEPESDKKAAGDKKKKDAKTIGAFVFEPKGGEKARPDEDGASESLWKRLTSSDEKVDETAELTAPLDELTPDEEKFVEQGIVEANVSASQEQPATDATTPEATVAEAAVERFRDKILNQAKSSDEALSETLDEIDAETVPVQTSETVAEIQVAEEPVDNPHEFTDQPIEITRSPATKEADDEATADTSGAASNTVPPPPGSGGAAGASGSSDSVGGSRPDSRRAISTAEQNEYGAYYDRSDVLGAALVGGFVGYLIGRRRGRIKTEKRLLPIQKKLEKRVENLRQDITRKEFIIRKAAAERANSQTGLRAETGPNQPARAAAIEAHRVHGGLHPERIGQVVVTAESSPELKAEKAALLPADKHVDTLRRPDLLELSSKIVIEGSSLRQIYETHLISEKGLRRLVAEHLRGGDARKALRQELIEHEIDFERDPLLRDQSHQAAADGGSVDLNNLLQQANVRMDEGSDEELAVLKARAVHQVGEQHKQQRNRRLIDASLVTTIAVLLAIVIYLAMSHR